MRRYTIPEKKKFEIYTYLKAEEKRTKDLFIPEILLEIKTKFGETLTVHTFREWAKRHNFKYKPERVKKVKISSDEFEKLQMQVKTLAVLTRNLCVEIGCKTPQQLEKLVETLKSDVEER